jgi:hypothetical protein
MIKDIRLIQLKLRQLEKQVSFIESSHQYWIGNKQRLTPVSNVISKVVPPFDPDGEILKKCAEREGITEFELKQQWEQKKNDACLIGTKFHSEAEMVINGCEQYIENKSDNLSQVSLVLMKHLSNIIGTEIIVFDKNLGISGTIDLITLDNAKGLIIWDWKTNDKIDEEGYGYLLPPLDSLKNSAYNKYMLQMGIYRYLLELNGFEVDSMNLIHIPKGKNEHTIISIPYMKDQIMKLILFKKC